MHRLLFVALVSGTLLLHACSSGSAPPDSAEETSRAASDPAPASAGTPVTVKTIAYEVPTSWTTETPSNSMRAAQYGFGSQGSLVIFFFGVGGGGGVESNMDRWITQVTQPDGSSTDDLAKRSTEEREGVVMHHLDVSGSWSGGMSGGGGDNYRLLCTVVEVAGGPYFFRLSGPADEVAAAEAGYRALCDSLRPAG